MASKLETAFVTKMRDSAVHNGALTIKIHGHMMQRTGWPDIEIYFHKGINLLIEAKTEEVKYSAIQRDTIVKLLERGHLAFGMRCEGEFIDVEFPTTDEEIWLARRIGKLSMMKLKPSSFWTEVIVAANLVVGYIERNRLLTPNSKCFAEYS